MTDRKRDHSPVKTRGRVAKEKKPLRSSYSPTLVIKSYNVENTFTIKVVRDDLLPGGTKQRGLVPLLASLPEEEFVMPSANSGMGQVALAVAAKMLGKTGTAFVAARAKETEATKLARLSGGNIQTVRPGYMTVRTKRAKDYTDERNSMSPGSTKLFSLGIDDPLFERSLLTQLRRSIPGKFKAPERVWIAVGSGLLMRVLGKLWPKTTLLGVQVGMRQSLEEILGEERAKNAKLFIEEELNFDQNTRDLPPWPSMPSYDAKLWKFIKLYGQEGDLVWNVGNPVLPSSS